MTTKATRISLRSAAILGALMLTTSIASATEGYFQLGFGPRQNAMGGTGVADSRDAMAMALNPAGIVGVDRQFQLGAGLFMPFRGYDTTGPGFVAPGPVDSDANLFAMPNAAYVSPIDANSAWGLTMYGNGGMNTTYADMANPACPPGGSGVFCGGAAGVNLMQAFLSADYARQMGPVKIGIAPTLAVQAFKAKGLLAFSPISADPAHLSNKGYDFSVGGGLRAGAEVSVMENVRLGVSGQTKMWMTKFNKYAGLFQDGGNFDIPASITAGLSVDMTTDLTFNFDYQHIFYSGVDAIANSSTTPAPLGSKGGPGFGWNDVNVFKVGAEWRANPQWTFRAGYAYSENPITADDVTFNILAPGVVKHHFTGGAAYAINDKDTLEFTGMYVPEAKVTGIEMTPMGPNPGRDITIKMHQFQLLAGWTHKF